MYSIRIDGRLLYSPDLIDDGYFVLSPKLTMELGKAGSLTFVITPRNPIYNNIRKLKSIVTVYDNGEEIFRGRVLYDEKDMFGKKNVYCEGELAFLLDSIQRPYEFTGDIPDLFKKFIDSHNEQVEEEKRFLVGNITVSDPNGYINRSNTNYTNTLDEINGKLIETHGGYIRPRLHKGRRYIDLVRTYGRRNSQTIEFGTNILDISEYITAENVFTVLIPLGSYPEQGSTNSGIIMSPTCPDCDKVMILDQEASNLNEGNYWIYECPDCGHMESKPKYSDSDSGTGVESQPTRITIESVNDGKDYIEDDAGIALFGRIVKVHEWDDVTLPENLLNKARALLDASIEMAVTLTLNAVDLHLVDADIERIGLGDSVRVVSAPHNLDRDFTCSKIVLDMANLDNSEYTFGAAYTTMTETQSAGTKVIQNAAINAQQANDTANKTSQSLQNIVMDYVPNSVYKEDMSQKGIFKILTNNGATQGILFDEATGDAYINASYIKSGTLTIGGLKSDSSRLEILDENGETCLIAGPEGIKVVKGEINATSGSLDQVTILDSIDISSTGSEGPKNLSLVKITTSEGGAGTVYGITIGEDTGKSTPLTLQGSSIHIKGASSLTFSADNIIFENTIEAPTAYFDDIHVGNAVHFDLDDAEKQIHSKTQTSTGEYPHDTKIYGGKAASKIALGVYDNANSLRVLVYDDVSKHIVSDLTDFYFGNTTDTQKHIYFNSTDGAKYPHQCALYGGGGNSKVAFGMWDFKNDRSILIYDDVNNAVRSESTLEQVTPSVTLASVTKSLSNRIAAFPFLRMCFFRARFTLASDVTAGSDIELGTLDSNYAPGGHPSTMHVHIEGKTAFDVSALISLTGKITIRSGTTIASGSKVYLNGCWSY